MRFTILSRNQIKLKSNVGFRGEGKTGVPGEKPLGAEQRTNKLSPLMTPSPGIEPGPHWWEANALTLRQPCSPHLSLFSCCLFIYFGYGLILIPNFSQIKAGVYLNFVKKTRDFSFSLKLETLKCLSPLNRYKMLISQPGNHLLYNYLFSPTSNIFYESIDYPQFIFCIYQINYPQAVNYALHIGIEIMANSRVGVI